MEKESTVLNPVPAAALPVHGVRCPHCGHNLASTRADRRFTLVDAMVLVAASAIALVIVRPLVTGPLHRHPEWARYLAWTIGGLVAWTPTVLFLRLREPRPAFRRLSRQPGFAACLAGTSIIILGSLAMGLLALIRVARRGMAVRAGIPIRPPDPTWWVEIVIRFGVAVGPAVIAAWLLLALSGRRRPARGWLDYLGRVIGIAWIVLFIVDCCIRLAYLKD